MSSGLVKRALELFKDDLVDPEEEAKMRKKKKKQTDAMSQIGTNKRGVKRELRRVRQQQRQHKLKNMKPPKTAHEELSHYAPVDHTQTSLDAFRRLSQLDATSSTTVNKILEHNRGPLSKSRRAARPAEDKSSLFTDDDFTKFEKEYLKGS